MTYLANIQILNMISLLILTCTFNSNGSYTRNQSEPVLLYSYFGDQTATTFLALDILALELMKQPDAQGCIIIYNGIKDPPGLAYRHSLGLKNYFVKTKSISSDRIKTVIGRDCEIFSVYVWLVWNDSKPPNPKCTFGTELQNKDSFGKFDEYLFDYEHPDGTLYDDPYLRLEGFAEELLKNANTVGYIIGYGHRQDRSEARFIEGEYVERKYQVWDERGTGKKLAEREKKVLIDRSKINSSRIITVDGGYREFQMIELWVVPSGAPSPKATPTVFPDKGKEYGLLDAASNKGMHRSARSEPHNYGQFRSRAR